MSAKPFVRLISVLIDALFSKSSLDYIDEIYSAIESYLKMLTVLNNEEKPEALRFLFRKLIENLDYQDSIIRQKILKVGKI